MSGETLRRAAALMRQDADTRWRAVSDLLIGESLNPSVWHTAAIAVAATYLGERP